jgi:hypothetical protein
MRKLVIVLTATVALLFAGLFAWNAEATTVTGAVTIGAKTYSPIVEEPVAAAMHLWWGPMAADGGPTRSVRRIRGAGAPLASLTDRRLTVGT